MNVQTMTILAVLNFHFALATPAAAGTDAGIQLSCGSYTRDRSEIIDYRLRDTTSTLQWRIADVKKNHLDPAASRMNEGIYSTRVIDDLNFILERVPNHYPALQELIRYKLGGGDADRHRPFICYFDMAQGFAPDDANVLVLKGMYLYKTGDNDRAEVHWQQALHIDPNSADAHYNLGLLYVERAQYQVALEHAVKAYSLGFPLPGLKNKLIQAGYSKQLAER